MLLCGNIVTMMFNMFVKFYVYIYVWFTTIILTDDNFLLQATSGKIACSNWLRRVTCRSVILRIRPVWITGFVSHFVHKGTTKGNCEKLQKFNEFSKLNTKSCISRTMTLRWLSKREFHYYESNNNKKNNIENDVSMSRYMYVRYGF